MGQTARVILRNGEKAMTALSEVEISKLPSVGKDSATVQATRLITPYNGGRIERQREAGTPECTL